MSDDYKPRGVILVGGGLIVKLQSDVTLSSKTTDWIIHKLLHNTLMLHI